MKDKLFELFETNGELQIGTVALHISMAAVLGFLIFVSYYITHLGTIYSKKFNASLVVLTVLTGTVMTVIGNNIALSLDNPAYKYNKAEDYHCHGERSEEPCGACQNLPAVSEHRLTYANKNLRKCIPRRVLQLKRE